MKPWLTLWIMLLMLPAQAGDEVFTPERGSVLRQTLMDTLLIPVMAELKQNLVFKIDWLKVTEADDWAFMRGQPLQPDGSQVDYRRTRYQEYIEAEVFEDWICALWQRQNDSWQVVKYVIGAIDVPYDVWPDQYGAPQAIFDIGQ
jgi:hypothetical protein